MNLRLPLPALFSLATATNIQIAKVSLQNSDDNIIFVKFLDFFLRGVFATVLQSLTHRSIVGSTKCIFFFCFDIAPLNTSNDVMMTYWHSTWFLKEPFLITHLKNILTWRIVSQRCPFDIYLHIWAILSFSFNIAWSGSLWFAKNKVKKNNAIFGPH